MITLDGTRHYSNNPCYNEEKNIKHVIEGVANYCSKIIVIDDSSTDNSFEIVSNLKDDLNKNF